MLRNDVFVGGRDGYHTYRIPALVIANDGALLAFCEGRRHGPADDGKIDLLLKRGSDNGRSWSAQTVVCAEEGDRPVTMGNPCPVAERATGCIHLLFTRNNKRLFHTRSNDGGLTWSPPRDFTNILDGFDYPRVRIATGPVHGIQTRRGRLVVPVWISDREIKEMNEEPTPTRFQSGTIHSDDHGATWAAGGLVPPAVSRLNECTVVERTDGSLLLNMRAHGAGFRAVATSADGGASWSEPALNRDLPCPTCQASIIRGPGGNLLFLNPAATVPGSESHGPRHKLTLRSSPDEGRTWSTVCVVNEGPSGYSDLAVAEDGSVLCLFENGPTRYNEKISILAVQKEILRADH